MKVKNIIISIGVSLIVGVLAGKFTSETKYFWTRKNKEEITQLEYFKVREDRRKSIRQFVIKEEVYNKENAYIFGLTTLGAMLIVTSLLPNKTES